MRGRTDYNRSCLENFPGLFEKSCLNDFLSCRDSAPGIKPEPIFLEMHLSLYPGRGEPERWDRTAAQGKPAQQQLSVRAHCVY